MIDPAVPSRAETTDDDERVNSIPVGQAIAALGDAESPSELAQRLAVAVAVLWPHVVDTDLFLPECFSSTLHRV